MPSHHRPRFADTAAAPSAMPRDAASFHFGAAPVAHAQACVTPERRRGLPVWITLSAGSVALLAAGYMSAMVQLGTKGAGMSTTPRVAQCAQTPSAPLEPSASSAVSQTAARARPASEVPAASAIATVDTMQTSRTHTRAKPSGTTRPGRAGAAVPSSITPAPELEHESGAPVMTIRPLSSTESTDAPSAPLSAATATAVEPSTGERPSRDEVMRGLAGLRSQLIECAAGRHGVVNTHVTIAPTGRVTYSLIGGDFVGSPEGSCMARALRSATFPSFTGPSLKVLFPYSL